MFKVIAGGIGPRDQGIYDLGCHHRTLGRAREAFVNWLNDPSGPWEPFDHHCKIVEVATGKVVISGVQAIMDYVSPWTGYCGRCEDTVMIDLDRRCNSCGGLAE